MIDNKIKKEKIYLMKNFPYEQRSLWRPRHQRKER